jgi:ADP-ribose pyrophosphatase YjhB (NUDIX family)
MTDEGFSGDSGAPPAPRFCSACGGTLAERWQPNEARHRLACNGCGRIQYHNPTVVAGVLLERDGRVLLLRRAYPPRAGAWVFPGGFVELGETAEQAAQRECLEEVAVTARLDALLGVYSRPGPGVVVVVYRGAVIDGDPRAAHEATDVRWFAPEQIPWSELAFDTTEAALHDWAAGVAGVQLPVDSRSARQVRKRRSSSS